jgi:putative membrane protein insertion efficiency factor
MTRAGLWLIRFYQRWVSRFLPSMCRFTPSCSAYAAQALQLHGFWRGTWLTIKRLARCQPLCRGGLDPVPPPRDRHAAPPPSEGRAQ